ncbi:MAG: hypothetical protein LUF29_00205 [Oscillospiraceae bacterium]|nr:hypothetical protein [Oscillospiraceae bacterium]
MKKLLAMVLSALLVLTIIPMNIFAAEKTGALDLSSYGKENASGDGWSWNASEKTLTITDLTITGTGTSEGIILPSTEVGETITVVLNGSNSISGFDQAIDVSPETNSTNIVISGTGLLSITDCTFVHRGTFENVTIDGATITATVENGFITERVFTIKNGANVSITATDSDAWSAIYAVEGVEISDSTVVAALPNHAYPAIYVTSSGTYTETYMNITNSSVSVSSSGSSWGIYCYGRASATTKITNSTITVDSLAGIYTNSEIILVGDVDVLTTSNRQLMYSTVIDSTGLGSGSDIEGYVRQVDEMFYLTNYILTSDFSVVTGRTLTIPADVTLTLADDVVLSSVDSGAIINNGSIVVPCTSIGGVADGSLSAESNSVTIEHSYDTDNIAWDFNNATATFTCSDCGDVQTVSATVESRNNLGVVTKVATATFNGVTYTTTQTTGTSLLIISADYSAVNEAIAKANALNASDYTNFADVTAAINAVDWTLNVLNQPTVNTYAEAIETAIANLIPVDSEEIEIDDLVEDSTTESEPEEATEPEPETNPTTGAAVMLLPMAIALAGAIVGKQKL